jgi:hypothetical protein
MYTLLMIVIADLNSDIPTNSPRRPIVYTTQIPSKKFKTASTKRKTHSLSAIVAEYRNEPSRSTPNTVGASLQDTFSSTQRATVLNSSIRTTPETIYEMSSQNSSQNLAEKLAAIRKKHGQEMLVQDIEFFSGMAKFAAEEVISRVATGASVYPESFGGFDNAQMAQEAQRYASLVKKSKDDLEQIVNGSESQGYVTQTIDSCGFDNTRYMSHEEIMAADPVDLINTITNAPCYPDPELFQIGGQSVTHDRLNPTCQPQYSTPGVSVEKGNFNNILDLTNNPQRLIENHNQRPINPAPRADNFPSTSPSGVINLSVESSSTAQDDALSRNADESSTLLSPKAAASESHDYDEFMNQRRVSTKPPRGRKLASPKVPSPDTATLASTNSKASEAPKKPRAPRKKKIVVEEEEEQDENLIMDDEDMDFNVINTSTSNGGIALEDFEHMFELGKPSSSSPSPKKKEVSPSGATMKRSPAQNKKLSEQSSTQSLVRTQSTPISAKSHSRSTSVSSITAHSRKQPQGKTHEPTTTFPAKKGEAGSNLLGLLDDVHVEYLKSLGMKEEILDLLKEGNLAKVLLHMQKATQNNSAPQTPISEGTAPLTPKTLEISPLTLIQTPKTGLPLPDCLSKYLQKGLPYDMKPQFSEWNISSIHGMELDKYFRFPVDPRGWCTYVFKDYSIENGDNLVTFLIYNRKERVAYLLPFSEANPGCIMPWDDPAYYDLNPFIADDITWERALGAYDEFMKQSNIPATKRVAEGDFSSKKVKRTRS